MVECGVSAETLVGLAGTIVPQPNSSSKTSRRAGDPWPRLCVRIGRTAVTLPEVSRGPLARPKNGSGTNSTGAGS